jgi:CheY-like chemotaxis protein
MIISDIESKGMTNAPLYSKIVIIDDSELQLFLAQTLISKHSVSKSSLAFVTASGALEYLHSIERAPEEHPDLILLDISMPEMDGFQFLDAFVSMSGILKDKCPIAMLTASMNTKDVERALSYRPVKGYFLKPIDVKTTLEQLTGLHQVLSSPILSNRGYIA